MEQVYHHTAMTRWCPDHCSLKAGKAFDTRDPVQTDALPSQLRIGYLQAVSQEVHKLLSAMIAPYIPGL